jgi:TolB protein
MASLMKTLTTIALIACAIFALMVTLGLAVGRAFASRDQLLFIALGESDQSALRLADVRYGIALDILHYRGWGTDAEWSPDGDYIAFSGFSPGNSERSQQRELYIMRVKDGDVRRIADNGLMDYNSPTWSPDGRHIAYQGYTTYSGWDIFIYDVETGESQNVFSSLGVGTDGSPAWSPDGRYIAFSTNSGILADNFDIYLLDVETGRTRPLSESPSIEVMPAWSPDGERLLYAATTGIRGYDLFVINRDGTGRVQLTDGADAEMEPSWSPDGERIAFVSNYPNGRQVNIYVMRADGTGDLRQITSGISGYRQPNWRP